MVKKIEMMREMLLAKLPVEQYLETEIEGVALFRRDTPYDPKPLIYKPQIIILAQGQKHVHLGDEVYTYDAEHYFVLTVPLPVICEAVIEKGRPMLGLALQIDPQLIGEILNEMDSAPPKKAQSCSSIYQTKISEDISDAVLRLLRAFDSKNEMNILGPLYRKEILFKILNGEHGEVLKDLAYNNRNLYQISRVINRIHENYAAPIEVQTLAEAAGMSASAFHMNFRSVTSTSPLQYIKNIRLHKAKELIQQEGERAYAAAIRVGYESSSQFSREYKRLFGVTPAKDRGESPVI